MHARMYLHESFDIHQMVHARRPSANESYVKSNQFLIRLWKLKNAAGHENT